MHLELSNAPATTTPVWSDGPSAAPPRISIAAPAMLSREACEVLPGAPWPTVRLGGLPVHAAGDPVGEADRWAEETLASVGAAPGDVVVLYGGGWGFPAAALAARWKGPLFVCEPVARLRADHLPSEPRPWSPGPPPGRPFDGPGDDAGFARTLDEDGRVHLLAWPPYARALPEGFQALRTRVEGLVREAMLYRTTLRMRAAEWADNAFTNAPHFPECHPVSWLDGKAAGRPVFVVAAGPSLDRNAALLGEAARRGVVIAVNHALGALDRAHVQPHLTAALEGRDVGSHFAVPEALYARQVLGTMSHPSLFDLPYTTRFACHIADEPVAARLFGALGDDALAVSGGSVATLAFALAARMGASAVVLVGQDLAFTAGRSYAAGAPRDDARLVIAAPGHGHVERRRDAADSPGGERIERPVTLLETTGWGGGAVLTSPSFEVQRTWFERAVAERAGSLRVVNATEGGARIAGTEEAALAEVLAGFPTTSGLDAALTPPPLDVTARRRRLHGFVRTRRRLAADASALLSLGSAMLARHATAPAARRPALEAEIGTVDRELGKKTSDLAELDPYLTAGADDPVAAGGDLAETAALYARVRTAARTLVTRFADLEGALGRKA